MDSRADLRLDKGEGDRLVGAELANKEAVVREASRVARAWVRARASLEDRFYGEGEGANEGGGAWVRTTWVR